MIGLDGLPIVLLLICEEIAFGVIAWVAYKIATR